MADEGGTSQQRRRVAKRIQRFFTQAHVLLYRLTGGKLGGGKYVLILTTVGRKSGRECSTPLFNFRDGNNFIVIASDGGAPMHPIWWLNLVAHPHAKIQVGSHVIPVTAKTADPEERKRLWSIVEEKYKNFVRTQKNTSREIPVVILSPNA